MCYNPPLVRDKPLGAQASVKLVYWLGTNLESALHAMLNAYRYLYVKKDYFWENHFTNIL